MSLKGNTFFFPSFCLIKRYFKLNRSFCNHRALQQNVTSSILISFTGEAEHRTGLAVTPGGVCEAGGPKEKTSLCRFSMGHG